MGTFSNKNSDIVLTYMKSFEFVNQKAIGSDVGFNLIPINSSPSDKKSSHLGGNRRIPSFNLCKKVCSVCICIELKLIKMLQI